MMHGLGDVDNRFPDLTPSTDSETLTTVSRI